MRTRVNQRGLYLMDEPDASLSFTASLGLVALLYDLIEASYLRYLLDAPP